MQEFIKSYSSKQGKISSRSASKRKLDVITEKEEFEEEIALKELDEVDKPPIEIEKTDN